MKQITRRTVCQWFHQASWRIDLSQEWGRHCERCERRFVLTDTIVDCDAWLKAKYLPELTRLLGVA